MGCLIDFLVRFWVGVVKRGCENIINVNFFLILLFLISNESICCFRKLGSGF